VQLIIENIFVVYSSVCKGFSPHWGLQTFTVMSVCDAYDGRCVLFPAPATLF
jgi:hypothetical protein